MSELMKIQPAFSFGPASTRRVYRLGRPLRRDVWFNKIFSSLFLSSLLLFSQLTPFQLIHREPFVDQRQTRDETSEASGTS